LVVDWAVMMDVMMVGKMAASSAVSKVLTKAVMMVDQRVGVLVEKLVGTSAEQWAGEMEEV